MARCLISLGSNLGDRRATLDRAVVLLRQIDWLGNLSISRWYETAPVGGPPGQPSFLNGAAAFDTSLSPTQLLAALQQIENQLGRTREVHWGPRTLDLDLLLYDDVQLDAPELTIPHPRIGLRRFVLEPAAEIAGEMRHPVLDLTIAELLEDLNR